MKRRLRIEALEDRTLPTGTVTWINPSGGDWDTASNWSGNAVPGPSDDVVINTSGITITHSAADTDSVNSITSQAAIVLSGGSLSLAAASSLKQLVLDGGTLNGEGNIVVSGSFSWSGGTLSGPVGDTVTAEGGMTASGGGLYGYTLVNPVGQTASLSGQLTLANGAVLDNEGTLALSDGATLTHASFDPSVQFTNEGSVQASGTGEMELWAPTVSSGAIEVLAGELDIGDGAGNGTSTFSGTMTAAPGATLYIDAPGGVDNFTPSSSIDAASVIFFNTGTFNVAGAYQAGSTTLDDRYGLPTVTMTGSVSGLGAVNVEGRTILDLSQANLASSATTLPSLSVGGTLVTGSTWTVTGSFGFGGAIEGGGTAVLTAQGGASLGGGTLDGVAVHLQGGSSMYGVVTLANGAVLDNEGTLALSDGATLTHASFDPSVQFTNEGSVQASGTGEMELWAPTVSSGAIEVLAGELDIGDGAGNGTSTFSGTMTAAPGATLYIDAPGGVDNFTPSSSIDAASVIFFNTGTFNVAGAYQAGSTTLDDRYGLPTVTMTGSVSGLGAVNVEGGTLDLSSATLAPAAQTLTSLTLFGGTLVASGAFAVSGGMSAYDSTLLAPAGTTASLTALQGGVSLGGTDNNSHLILDGFTVVNPAGRTSDLNYHVLLYDGAVLDNQGTLTVHDISTVGRGDSSNVQFRNSGLLEKLDGTVNAGLNVPVVNTGTINLQSGDMTLGDFAGNLNTSAGTITAAAGTFLGLVGTWAITGAIQADQMEIDGTGQANQVAIAGSVSAVRIAFNANQPSITGTLDADSVTFALGYPQVASVTGSYRSRTGTVISSGAVQFYGAGGGIGALSIGGGGVADFTPAAGGPVTLTFASLAMSNGSELTGTDNFIVAGPFTWNGGDLAGSPNTTLTAEGGMTLSGGNLYDRTLVNAGAAVWNGGGVGIDDDASFINTGTFDDQIDGNFGGPDCPLFDNQGLFLKSGGNGTTYLQMMLQNSGTVNIEHGTLELSCGFVQGSGGSISGSVSGSFSNPGQYDSGPSPNPPVLTNYTQTVTGTLDEQIGGLTAGTQYGQIIVNGDVNLAGTLQVVLINGFTAQLGNQFTIIDNRGNNPINGTFTNLPEGATVWDTTHTYRFTISYVGGDGNDVVLTAQQTATTTALTATANPSVTNQAVTFTATITPAAGSGTPTGTVQFQIDGVNAGATVALNGGIAGFSTATLPVGTHTIAALYSGDSSFQASSGSLNQTVNQDTTTTTVTSSVASAIPGQPIAFTVTVQANAPGSGTPTGSVDFFDTTTNTDLGSVPLSGGTAVLSTSALSLGSHTIEGIYSGDGNFLSSNASLAQAVTVTQSIYILNSTAAGALNLSGNASISIPAIIDVDSNSSTAIVASGNASVTATSIQVVGGYSTSGNARLNPKPATGAASFTDPLACLPIASVSGSRTAVSVAGNSSVTINAGIYTSISVSGNGTLTMTAGIYVIAGGGFSVSGNGTVSGSGVMIYNTGSAYPNTGGSFGAISFSGNTTVSLTAPTSGPYAGVLIFQSRDNGRAIALSGNASASGGTIYAANAALVLSGNANLPHLAAVVSTLSLSGGAFQLADGATSDYVSSTSNQILFGALTVAVQDDTGNGIDPNEVNRISDAMTYLNDALGSFGVYLTWAAPGTDADVHIHFASNSPYGGASDGVLGFTTSTNDVYLVTTGWSFYTEADSSGIGAGQYDFLTLATHELAHTVGLGESSDPASVMYEYLAPGTVRRTFTDSNLSLINTDADRFMKAALPTAHGSALLPGHTLNLSVFWQGAIQQERAVANLFGAMLFPASINPQNDGYVATTPGLDGDDSVLVGGSGNDLVIGGQGRNVMTGGFGFDRTTGVGDHQAAERAQDQVFASFDDGV